MRKVIGMLLLAVINITVIGGCGSKVMGTQEDKMSEQPVTLRMTSWGQEQGTKKLLEYLEEAVPGVKIEYQFIDNSNYNVIVDTQLATGEGPDIMCLQPIATIKHAKLGNLVDVTSLSHKFSEEGNRSFTVDEKVYGLPGVTWFEGIFLNKDIFEQNDIKLPKTFDEYIEVCKRFQELEIKPLAAGLKFWDPMFKSSMGFVTAEYLSKENGKHFAKNYREGKTTLAEAWEPYIERWSEMISSGVYSKDMLGIDNIQALEEFAAGQAAMICSGPAGLNFIRNINADLNVDMIPFYGTEPGEGWLIGGISCGYVGNANSKYPEEVMKVLEAIATPEAQKALWETNQGSSSYLLGVNFEIPDAYHSARQALYAGNLYSPCEDWGEAGVLSIQRAYGMELQKYLMGKQDIKTTLSNVDSVVQEFLSK